jgi:hypothetical protein
MQAVLSRSEYAKRSMFEYLRARTLSVCCVIENFWLIVTPKALIDSTEQFQQWLA